MLTTEEAVLQHFGGDPLWANESDIRDGRQRGHRLANAATVSLALAEGMAADEARVEAAITALATLLANSTTAGSYRSALGLGTDPAGLHVAAGVAVTGQRQNRHGRQPQGPG